MKTFAAISARYERQAVVQRSAGNRLLVETTLRVFASGAAAGYLNPACHAAGWPPGYPAAAREVIAAGLRSQAGPDGAMEAVFNRLFLLAHKP
jgi:hypothetical protein